MPSEYDATVDIVEKVPTGPSWSRNPEEEDMAVVHYGNGQQGHFQIAPGRVKPGQKVRIKACSSWPEVKPLRLDDD